MKVPILPILALILASVACEQAVVPFTPTPTSPPATAPVPSSTRTPAPTAAETEVETATVRAALVNVRTEPGGEVVGQITAGTDVRVLGCADDWCEVETDDISGYVFVGCLSISDGKGCSAK